MASKSSNEKGVSEIMKNYPWIEKFDSETKANLTTAEVTGSHVLKLLTFLETHISSEVSNLRNKPNRATKFISLIKKRICMVKVGGFMLESEAEHELYPTYALLMQHFVNITLASSKVEKQGRQAVATDLYYSLKLIFEGDIEYVLDVVLCSNLDEHAGVKDDIGFELFSYILEDWRFYSDTYSALLKYYTVAALLSDCKEGKQLAERQAHVKMDGNFVLYLNKTLGSNLKPQKKMTLAHILSHVKPRRVIALTRKRLVVVSRKDVFKRNKEGSADCSVASTSSTVVASSSRTKKKLAVYQQVATDSHQQQSQTLDELLSDLGVSFTLDTEGGYNGQETCEYDVADSQMIVTVPEIEESEVTSSTSNKALGFTKTSFDEDYEVSNEDIEMGSVSSKRRGKKKGRTMNRKTSDTSESSIILEENGESDRNSRADSEESDPRNSGKIRAELRKELDAEFDSDEAPYRSDEFEGGSDHGRTDEWQEVKVTQNSASEEDLESLSKASSYKDLDSDDEEDNIKPKKLFVIENATSPQTYSDDLDSDLEICEIATVNNSRNDDDSSFSGRDEADAESGEDTVPNYDVDSDEEMNDQVEKSNKKITSVNKNELMQVEITDESSRSSLNKLQASTSRLCISTNDVVKDKSEKTAKSSASSAVERILDEPETEDYGKLHGASASGTDKKKSENQRLSSSKKGTKIDNETPLTPVPHVDELDCSSPKRSRVQVDLIVENSSEIVEDSQSRTSARRGRGRGRGKVTTKISSVAESTTSLRSRRVTRASVAVVSPKKQEDNISSQSSQATLETVSSNESQDIAINDDDKDNKSATTKPAISACRRGLRSGGRGRARR